MCVSEVVTKYNLPNNNKKYSESSLSFTSHKIYRILQWHSVSPCSIQLHILVFGIKSKIAYNFFSKSTSVCTNLSNRHNKKYLQNSMWERGKHKICRWMPTNLEPTQRLDQQQEAVVALYRSSAADAESFWLSGCSEGKSLWPASPINTLALNCEENQQVPISW